MVTRFDVGQAVSKIGGALGAGEYGLSEKIGGYNQTYDYVDHPAAPSSNETYAVKKADGGYDYFVNGQQASLQDYYNAGGQIPADEPTLQGTGADTTQGTTGGGGTTATFQPTWYNGVYYTDENSYVDAVNTLINTNYNKSVSNAQKMYQNGLISLDEMEENIRSTRKNLIKQRDANLQGTSSYFSRISPDVLQSQQSRYEGQVNENFGEANTKLGGEGVSTSYRNLDPAAC